MMLRFEEPRAACRAPSISVLCQSWSTPSIKTKAVDFQLKRERRTCKITSDERFCLFSTRAQGLPGRKKIGGGSNWDTCLSDYRATTWAISSFIYSLGSLQKVLFWSEETSPYHRPYIWVLHDPLHLCNKIAHTPWNSLSVVPQDTAVLGVGRWRTIRRKASKIHPKILFTKEILDSCGKAFELA